LFAFWASSTLHAQQTTGGVSVNAYFNPGAFAAQASGTIGDGGRNALFQPDFRHVDVSLSKTFPLREHLNPDLRVEVFNFTNTPNFGAPNASLPAPPTGSPPDTPSVTLASINNPVLNPTHFGQILAMTTNYTPREVQFALKLRS
jgi:hypothetical protein